MQAAMVSHFLFEAEFCTLASGWEKGQIEKNVQDARHRLWQPMPDFPSLAALNGWLETRCRELWAQTLHGSQPGAIVDVWADEVGRLMPLSRPFDGFVEYAKRVCRRRAWSIGPQSLQRAGVVRQSSGQPAGVSRAHRRRRRGADASGHRRGDVLGRQIALSSFSSIAASPLTSRSSRTAGAQARCT